MPEVLQVSKSRKLPVLLDTEEMTTLLDHLSPFTFFDGSRPLLEEEATFSKETFLEGYKTYIDALKAGTLPDETTLRPLFSSMITCDPTLVYSVPLSSGKVLVKPSIPIIQLQRHHFIYTDQFLSGVMGEESITWGIQFSYPQLYLDPDTQALGKVDKSFANTELFQKLSKWIRANTRATPFLVEGKKQNVPIRLGKECFSWINNHPALAAKHLEVLS